MAILIGIWPCLLTTKVNYGKIFGVTLLHTYVLIGNCLIKDFSRFKLISNAQYRTFRVFLCTLMCIRISICYISELLGDLRPWSDGRFGLYWSTSVVGTPWKAHFERRIDVWRPISSCRPYGKSRTSLDMDGTLDFDCWI